MYYHVSHIITHTHVTPPSPLAPHPSPHPPVHPPIPAIMPAIIHAMSPSLRRYEISDVNVPEIEMGIIPQIIETSRAQEKVKGEPLVQPFTTRFSCIVYAYCMRTVCVLYVYSMCMGCTCGVGK